MSKSAIGFILVFAFTQSLIAQVKIAVSISSSGSHTHPVNVNSGGSGAELNITPEYLSVNNFIFLGQ